MKLLIAIFIYCIFMHGVFCAEDNHCVTRAKQITVNMTDCCKFPDLFDPIKFNQTYDKIKDSKVAVPGTPLFDCLLEQTILKDLKFIDDSGNFLNDTIKKYIADTIKDDKWRKIIIQSYDKCLVEAPMYADAYQKDTKISTEICDFKYDAIGDCIDIGVFSKCPKNAWTKDSKFIKPCDHLKKFVTECYKDIIAVDEFLDNQKD